VDARGHAEAHREVQGHHEPHGADPVPPTAESARGGAQPVRRLLDALHGARRRALPTSTTPPPRAAARW
jgi:hypothetical protein